MSPHGPAQYHSAVRLLLVACVWVTQCCHYQCGSRSRGQSCQAPEGSRSVAVSLCQCCHQSSTTFLSGLYGSMSICALPCQLWRQMSNCLIEPYVTLALCTQKQAMHAGELFFNWLQYLSWLFRVDVCKINFISSTIPIHLCSKHLPQVITLVTRLISINELRSHYSLLSCKICHF